MPNQTTLNRAQQDLARGKSASTAAGEFVREEIHHIREGKHGAKNTRQAVAIGLSKARRAGIPLKTSGAASPQTKRKAAQDRARAGKPKNPRRASASLRARQQEPRASASSSALSERAKRSAATRRRMGRDNSPRAVARRAAETRKRRSSRSR